MDRFKEYVKTMIEAPPNWLTWIGAFITIIGTTTTLSGWVLVGTAIVVVGVLFMALVLMANTEYLLAPTARYYPDRNSTPARYRPMQTLDELAVRRGELTVVGRSCFYWLCGSEIEYNKAGHSFEQERKERSQKIKAALHNGSSLHFVIQNPYEPVADLMPPNENMGANAEEALLSSRKLSSQIEEAISSFKAIRKEYLQEIEQSPHREGIDRGRSIEDRKCLFMLSVYHGPIRNTILQLRINQHDVRYHLDLRAVFEDPTNGLSKPLIIFSSSRLGSRSVFEQMVEPFRDDIKRVLDRADTVDKYDEKRRDVEQQIKEIERTTYPYHSEIRKNTASALISLAANIYLAEHGSPPWKSRRIPPACVQLLVTNRCTTICKMCDHYKLYRAGNELETFELKRILDSIRGLGTNAVILSGGEPLARPDIDTILAYGKSHGLSIGLLTNGLRLDRDTNEVRPITLQEAETIANTCSWVQVSIDAFMEQTYSNIRTNGSLAQVQETIARLNEVKFKHVEMCYTIQKANSLELMECSKTFPRLARWLPNEYQVRFKFAHGLAKGRDFLCSEEDLRKIVKEGGALENRDPRFLFKYLETMINNQIFDFAGLSNGEPVKKSLCSRKQPDYTCMALRLTCKIDAYGDVYPCCFLFDDNVGISDWRDNYRLGSLRQDAGTTADPRGGNELETIWYGDELKSFRRRPLPVNEKACAYCSRHFHQNLFMNALSEVFRKHAIYRVAEEQATKDGANDVFWV